MPSHKVYRARDLSPSCVAQMIRRSAIGKPCVFLGRRAWPDGVSPQHGRAFTITTTPTRCPHTLGSMASCASAPACLASRSLPGLPSFSPAIVVRTYRVETLPPLCLLTQWHCCGESLTYPCISAALPQQKQTAQPRPLAPDDSFARTHCPSQAQPRRGSEMQGIR